MPTDPRDPAATRTPSRGACFLYVAPCAYEDLLKIGFSRDPLQRFQSLHPRWFEFFDLERIGLVETDTVREARALETRLKRELVEHRTPMPLTVVREAGGKGEWCRGAGRHVAASMASLAQMGHRVHAPARPWLRERLQQQRELLYAWAEAMLTVDELEGRAGATPRQRVLRDVLDAFVALDVPAAGSLPAAVLAWYRGAQARQEPAPRGVEEN